jgi:hypothetical protein
MNRKESTFVSNGEGKERSVTTSRSDIRLAATPQPVYFSEVVAACATARARGAHTDLLLAGRGGEAVAAHRCLLLPLSVL